MSSGQLARAADRHGAEGNLEPSHAGNFLAVDEIAVSGIHDPPQADAADLIRVLLARLDAAIARGGRLEVNGRTLLIRPVAGGCYRVGRP